MAAKDDVEAKVQYLAEHLAYEREMLGYTYARLHDTPPGLGWNMVYESFGVHTRNLYHFFRNEGNAQTTFRADDYVKSWRPPNAFLRFNDLDIFLFHMSTGRIERQKLNVERLQELGIWLTETWSKFVAELTDPYKGILTDDRACPALPLREGVTKATACTMFSVAVGRYPGGE